MNTLSDGPRSATGGTRPEDALLRAVADMDPAWIVLRDCALADGAQVARARVSYALLHPDIGIALLDLLPGVTTPDAPNRLRALLDAVGFTSAFGDYPPIVYLCVPSRSLFGLDGLLVREFDLQPPLALTGGDAWVGAVQGVLTTEPPLCMPGRTGTETQPSFPAPTIAQEGSAGRPAPRPKPGLRGLAVFWSVVTLAFGGGALVLQSLGPPEGSPVAAHASGTKHGEAEPSRAMLAAREAWMALPDSDKMRPPSPNPVLTLWPAERMPVRLDAARDGAPESDGWAVFDPRVDEDRSTPSAGVAIAAPSPEFSISRTAGTASIGRDEAGGARASVAGRSSQLVPVDSAALPAGGAGSRAGAMLAPEASLYISNPLQAGGVPGLAEAGRGSGGAFGATAIGSDTGAMDADTGTLQRLFDRSPGQVGPADSPHASALASPDFPEGATVDAPPPKPQEDGGAGAGKASDAATASPPREAAFPIPTVVQGAPSKAPETGGEASIQPSAAPDDLHPSAGTAAPAGAGPLPPDAASRAGWDGAVTRATGPDAPLAEDAQDAAQADARGARMQEGHAARPDALPRRDAAGPEGVGGTAPSTDASTPAFQAPTPSGEGTAPVPTPVVGVRPVEPSGEPGTPVPQAAAVPPAGAAEPAASSAVAPVARPAMQEPRDRAVPADETGRRSPATASMPPSLIEALVARGDAMMARRDISAARLLYERAAIAGNAQAASALGRTYDPAFLAEIGARGIRGDAALATAWYQKAASLGDGSALARMEALSGPDAAARGRP